MVRDKRNRKSMYLMLMGFALVTGAKEVYEMCAAQLGDSKRSLGSSYEQAATRTDIKIRRVMNLSLQCSILLCDVALAEGILVFGRANTLLIQTDDSWLQVALRVTQKDGPG